MSIIEWLGLIFFMYNRKYGLDDNTVDFIGHALALHRDDSYLDGPAMDFVKRIKVANCFILSLLFIILPGLYDDILFIQWFISFHFVYTS